MNFSYIIHEWYEKNSRDLPMRQTRDPYRTWVAEIIFQQTRLDQGLPYLENFLRIFPDVHALAAAGEDEVLRQWQGLGYYSRVRNLHASARHIVAELGGLMPGSYKELLKLKGVGKYTAAAIASWCYGEPVAAVDGNVARVIARLYGIDEAINAPSGEKKVQELATRLLNQGNRRDRGDQSGRLDPGDSGDRLDPGDPGQTGQTGQTGQPDQPGQTGQTGDPGQPRDPGDPGMHNQAMIDFGAMLCMPSPDCSQCPLVTACEAHKCGEVDRIPVKVKNKKPVDRWFYYYMVISGGHTILVQRKGKDIWEGLYELPLIESEGPLSEEEIIGQMQHRVLPRALPVEARESVPGYSTGSGLIGKLSEPLRHQLSHQTIHARFLQVELEKLPDPLPEKWQPVAYEELENYALPRLIHRYLESVNF